MQKQPLLLFTFLIALSLVEHAILIHTHATGLSDSIRATISPITGHAWWRAYQNRLLAGIVVKVVGNYEIFLIASLVAINALTYVLYRNVWTVLLTSSAFILLQDPKWIYGWDVLQMILGTALIIGIVRGYGLRFFVPLFVVSLLNRESGLYIPLMFVLIFVQKKQYGLSVLWLALGGAGALWTQFARKTFFHGSCEPSVGQDLSHAAYGNHFWLLENLRSFFYSYDPSSIHIFDPVPFAITLVLLFFLLCWKYWGIIERSMALLCAALWVSILFVGIIHELRVWLDILPFAVFLSVSFKTFVTSLPTNIQRPG